MGPHSSPSLCGVTVGGLRRPLQGAGLGALEETGSDSDRESNVCTEGDEGLCMLRSFKEGGIPG